MTPLLLTCTQLGIILACAPLSFGFIQRYKSKLEGRGGTNPLLPYKELRLWLNKENIISPTASWAFRAAPYITLSASIFLALSLPLLAIGGAGEVYSHFLLFIGVLAFAGAFHAFGAVDSGGVMGGIGASRQTFITALSQPTLVLLFTAFAVKVGTGSISGMIQGQLSLFNEPFIILSLVALVLIALAENNRYPVDNPESSLELTMIREALDFHYSGPYLAMMEYASMIKLFVFMLLISNLAFPYALMTVQGSWLQVISVIFLSVFKLIIMSALIAVLEVSIAKMKFYRLQEYLASSFFIALASLVLVLITGRI